jgi:tRNA (guanine37-N1)-methyltransferase
MDFEVVTLFPEMFESFLAAGLLGKAVKNGTVKVAFTNPRDFAPGAHRKVDDTPYGGGVGMVMQAPILVEAIEAAVAARGPAHRVLLTPVGKPLTQARVRELAAKPRVLLVCGRYEGVDERVRALAIDEEISLGDFVLTGGEPAAMALVDAVARYVPGVLGDATSADDESFSAGRLEYPQYTRPPEFRGQAVPEILLSGDHAKIRAWRDAESLERTRTRRPDLLASERAATDERVDGAAAAALASRTHVALVHHPVYDKNHKVVTTAVTNLDVHDIARAARTFALAGYVLVSPIAAQRELIGRIIGHWTDADGEGRAHNSKRSEALANVSCVASLDDAIAQVAAAHGGERPFVVATAARGRANTLGTAELVRVRSGETRPVLIVFGTGWGLTDEVFTKVDATLHPIKGATEYNHLSVRAAVAIVLDRFFGQAPK